MKYQYFYPVALVCMLSICVIGCNNENARFSHVTGVVTLNGEPVSGATIRFTTESEEGESATGITDASGRYTLTSSSATDGGRGALPGEYRVSISKLDVPPNPDQEAYDRGEISYDELQVRLERNRGAGGSARELMPARTAVPRTTDLRATVVSGRNTFNFDLTN